MNSRRKGVRGELQWRDFLREHGFEARRGQQHSGSPDSPDVVCDELPIHWEVKLVNRLELHKAVAQARADCGDKCPVVAHRRDREDWLVTLDAKVFLRMLQTIYKPVEWQEIPMSQRSTEAT